jgi:hypothetical protein
MEQKSMGSVLDLVFKEGDGLYSSAAKVRGMGGVGG